MNHAENWRSVRGYEGIYEVSTLGNVRSLDRTAPNSARRFRGRLLKPTLSQGRLTVTLCRLGASRTRPVHTLVAEAFLGDRPSGADICHENGQCQDNRVQNLRYDTRSSNVFDAVRHGTYSNGRDRQTACSHGHPFDSTNTYVRPDGDRGCRACRREAVRRHRARKRVTS